MKLNFRQGIVRSRLINGTPDFLQQNQNNPAININITTTPLIVTATYGAADYLIQESVSVTNAWGPFVWNSNWGTQPGSVTYYLYWNIDLGTAKISRGYTPWAPIISLTTPVNPGIDQHWYDLNTFITKVWNGSVWVNTIRVFAGSWALTSHLIVPSALGTQVGITSAQYNILAGFILLGNDLKGIRTSDGNFLTSESDVIINQGNYTSPVQLEALSTQAIAIEPIPAYSCVTIVGQDQIGLSIAGDVSKLAIGIVTENLAPGDTGRFVYSGIVINQNWNWNITLGKILYVGNSGEITQTTPATGTANQQIATIINATTIFLMPGVSGIVGPVGPMDPSLNFYDISGGATGSPTALAVILTLAAVRPFHFLTNAAGSGGYQNVQATANTIFTINKNGVSIGTMTFQPGVPAPVFVVTATSFAIGDVLTVVAPATADATLADIGFTLAGKI